MKFITNARGKVVKFRDTDVRLWFLLYDTILLPRYGFPVVQPRPSSFAAAAAQLQVTIRSEHGVS